MGGIDDFRHAGVLIDAGQDKHLGVFHGHDARERRQRNGIDVLLVGKRLQAAIGRCPPQNADGELTVGLWQAVPDHGIRYMIAMNSGDVL